MQTVRDIMTTIVQTIHRDTIICEAENLFVAHNISGAPLTDDLGRLVGFVSKSDIIRFGATGDDPNYVKVFEIASPIIITIIPTASIEEAARKMLDKYLHHLIVMEEEALVGVLSAFDFVKLVARNTGKD